MFGAVGCVFDILAAIAWDDGHSGRRPACHGISGMVQVVWGDFSDSVDGEMLGWCKGRKKGRERKERKIHGEGIADI